MKTAAKTRNRRVDRTADAVSGVLMAAFVGASPFATYAAARWADATFSRAARTQQANLRQVSATLLQTAPAGQRGARSVPHVPAQWRGPDGLLRTGRVAAPAGTAAGSRVKVWINQAGEVVAPPMQQAQIARRVKLAEGLAAAGVTAGLGVIGLLARPHGDRNANS